MTVYANRFLQPFDKPILGSFALAFLLSVSCTDTIAPIAPRAPVCSSNQDCDSSEFCYLHEQGGRCLRAEVQHRCSLNGILERGEGCDDGNEVDDDGCTSNCVPARCGDGIVRRDLTRQDRDYEQCEPSLHVESANYCRNDCLWGTPPRRLVTNLHQTCLLNDAANGSVVACWGTAHANAFSARELATGLQLKTLHETGLAEETSGWTLYFPSDDDERQNENETVWQTDLRTNGNDGGLAHFARRPLTMEVKSWGMYDALLCEAGGQSAEQCAARTYRYITAVGLNGYPRARGDNHPFVNVIPTNICEFLESGETPESNHNLLDEIADVRAVASSHASTCAVHGDGRVTCWGDQRGWGSGSGNCEFASPRLLDEVSDVVAIRAEERSFIARRADGQIYLWGEVPETWAGQADGRFQCDRTLQSPTLATLDGPAEEIAAATCTHCLRDRNDRVFCRGLFDGVYEEPGWKNHPALVDVAELSKASQDVHHLCARFHDDSLRCWGRALSASAYERGSRLDPYRLREPQHISRFVAP